MDDETELRSRALRAIRAWLDIDQKDAAAGASLGWRSLLDAEKGRSCSDKTWAAMTRYYASQGVIWISDEHGLRIVIR